MDVENYAVSSITSRNLFIHHLISQVGYSRLGRPSRFVFYEARQYLWGAYTVTQGLHLGEGSVVTSLTDIHTYALGLTSV